MNRAASTLIAADVSVTEPPTTLKAVLGHPVALEIFKSYAVSTATRESVMFLVDCDNFRLKMKEHASDATVFDFLRHIRKTYAEPASPFEVNISMKLREDVVKFLSAENADNAWATLQKAEQEVFSLLNRDVWPRFM